ncbi:MAG: isoamylase early set domain-containing protein [Sandaracinaceae bacterium]|nr:isoamylase early set domain-containing protein [Sandaracinaceae bacterium]
MEDTVLSDSTVPVRFVLPAAGAREVYVAGEFNGWDASLSPLRDEDGDGVFNTTLSLERGAYAYMFVVDGERWVTDPFADAYRDDGFGNRNAIVRIP